MVLPDGSAREGVTDAHGFARFHAIDPGTCDVSFPDLHQDEWRPA